MDSTPISPFSVVSGATVHEIIAGRELELIDLVEQTYLQHAQPSTFGHYLLGSAYPVLRTIDRLSVGLDGINRSPAGAGGVNGSPLTGDRDRMAELLGFDGVIEHTRDAMWQSDVLTGLVADAATLATTLDRLAEDLEIFSSAEFGWVCLGAGHTRSSVLMPQKRNPYALTMVRGEAGVLIGRATGMLALAKSPSARSDNLIFGCGEATRALDLATRATRLMAGVVRELTIDAARMHDALYGGFAQAADLAEHLMMTMGLDYRSAYELVGVAVRRAATEGLRGVDITGALLDVAAAETGIAAPSLAGVDLTAALDPAVIVRGRQTQGGAAPEIVRGMAKDCAEKADALLAAIRVRRARFAAADAAVITQAARAMEEE